MKERSAIQAGRRYNYDLLRIISSVAVIAIHANWYFFSGVYENPSNSVYWVFQALMNIITRFCVPSFVMISGAFILSNDKNKDMSCFYQKSLVKIFFPAATACLLFVLITVAKNVFAQQPLYDGLKSVITGEFYNLWYIYMLVGLYFITPLIIRMKGTLSWNQYRFFAVIMLLWGIVSQATSGQSLAYSIGAVFAFLGYYLIGDVIKTEIENGWKPKKAILCVAGMICVVVAYFVRKAGFNYFIANPYTNFFSPVIVIYALCVFMIFGTMDITMDCSWLSARTFYLYIFHTIILKVMHAVTARFIQNVIVSEIIMVVLTFVAALIASVIYDRLWKMVKKPVEHWITSCGLLNLFDSN